jgi:hypothetical protein
MSSGVVYWYDLVTLKRKGSGHEHKHDQRDVVVRQTTSVACAAQTTLSSQPTAASVSLTGAPFAQVTLLHRSWTSVARSRSSAGVSRALDLVRFDDGRRRQQVSCLGHRSSFAMTRASSWATMSCLPRGSAGLLRCPSMWTWRSTTSHFAHSPANNANGCESKQRRRTIKSTTCRAAGRRTSCNRGSVSSATPSQSPDVLMD